jgi:ATP-binding cassette subfamily F protein uup
LSYKEQRELEVLPTTIEKLESKRGALHAQMADADFYRQPGAGIASAQQRLDEIEADLSRAYERWEVLEEKQGG